MKSSIVFGFDARFMLDALTQFEKQELVTMRLTGSLGAISLVAGGSSAIVLPVRLREVTGSSVKKEDIKRKEF